MTLKERAARARSYSWLSVVGAMTATAIGGLAAGLDGVGLFSSVYAVGGVMALAWPRMMRRRLQRVLARHQQQLEAALVDGDMELYRELIDEADEYYRALGPRTERQRLRLRGQAHAGEERWDDALAAVAAIDPDKLPPAERVSHDNLVAWCCAHAGDPARAVELAGAAIASSKDARTRPYLLGTLGAALVLDGQHAAAQAPLREAIALGGPRWAQTVRHYYLGEVLAGLGRFDEARAEWQLAVTIGPRSRWGRRAQERLTAGLPAAYR